MKRREKDAERFISRQKSRADMVVSFSMRGKAQALSLDMKTFFPAEEFASALSACRGLEVSHEYLDSDFQRLVVQGDASPAEITAALDRLGTPLDDYNVVREGFAPGLNGVLQAAAIYCLNEKLQLLAGGD
jgi:hypothetical protein